MPTTTTSRGNRDVEPKILIRNHSGALFGADLLRFDEWWNRRHLVFPHLARGLASICRPGDRAPSRTHFFGTGCQSSRAKPLAMGRAYRLFGFFRTASIFSDGIIGPLHCGDFKLNHRPTGPLPTADGHSENWTTDLSRCLRGIAQNRALFLPISHDCP